MNEPRTPSGKLMDTDLAYDSDPAGYMPGDYLKRYHDAILAIEDEAAAMERERLIAIAQDPDQSELAYCSPELHQHAHGWCNGRAWHWLFAEASDE